MTVTPKITVNDGNLVVHGKTILTGVPDNIVLTPGSGLGLVAGAFIGATASNSKSLHVFPVGVLEGTRFLCCFRFKLWWMTQRMGTSGRDIPFETQFLLMESQGNDGEDPDNSSTIYTVFLPLLEGQFRAALQGNEKNEMEICLESGDNTVETNQGLSLVYMHAGTNPFEVITQAVKAVEKHTQTFLHREKKKLPSFLDWFGWCTWDAFYTDVTAEGVVEGLQSLSDGGAPPKFLIIDDGWQQIEAKPKDADCVVQEGAQFASRLSGIKENHKFQKNGNNYDQVPGLKVVVDDAKKQHKVKFVYAWHALAGYWGGVKPASPGMEHYDSALAYPVQSPGMLGNQPDIVVDSLAVHGIGLVHPKKVFNFYNELHSYLASCGIDGVKVDVQNIIETLGAGHGGRVTLTRSYHQALEASIARNFSDNGCIACMCHNTDSLYSAKQTAVVRASDDYYPRDPASHTIHISSVAYNSLFLGEFMQPDWDMFHSLHPTAEYHGAARAIGGCAIYVSDKPGNHNFDLLKKLVLPDGSVLRAQLPGRPTRDSLFNDPARDGTSLLKIWNMNKCSGVVGVFNCQGAGWCRIINMAGIFDKFRFGAKREREEDTADVHPAVDTVADEVPAKKGKSKREPESEKEASESGKWQERWHGICDDCFERAQPCVHYPEHRLRLLIVGHNPSDHAWKTGYSYSNPTNRMWMLLTGTLSPHCWEGILPSSARIPEQNILPLVHGVGFTSIGMEPGNDASKYGKRTMEAWRDSFFRRLRRHAVQVCLNDHSEAMKRENEGEEARKIKCDLPHAPILVAFSGKRQFSWLFSPPLSKIENYGKQTRLPPGWPHELRADSEVWVLPSSSGRAAMTTAQRTLPYQQLAERLREIPWGPSSNEQCVVKRE